jgi:hypothetical protein
MLRTLGALRAHSNSRVCHPGPGAPIVQVVGENYCGMHSSTDIEEATLRGTEYPAA